MTRSVPVSVMEAGPTESSSKAPHPLRLPSFIQIVIFIKYHFTPSIVLKPLGHMIETKTFALMDLFKG
jgi:hypothetical protein